MLNLGGLVSKSGYLRYKVVLRDPLDAVVSSETTPDDGVVYSSSLRKQSSTTGAIDCVTVSQRWELS